MLRIESFGLLYGKLQHLQLIHCEAFAVYHVQDLPHVGTTVGLD